MIDVITEIDSSIEQVERISRTIKKGRSPQVGNSAERQILKSLALAWLRNHRTSLLKEVGAELLAPVDAVFQKILEGTERRVLRSVYVDQLKQIKAVLVSVRSKVLLIAPDKSKNTNDEAPDFGPLVTDPAMQRILTGRWVEIIKCITVDAHLAATVMMGGLLEGLLLARINHSTDKKKIFTAASAPRDKKTGQTEPLSRWMLKDYIDVAHELNWITQSAKDVGEVLRDYRNYIHPQKELTHGVQLGRNDSRILWEVSKAIVGQVVAGVR